MFIDVQQAFNKHSTNVQQAFSQRSDVVVSYRYVLCLSQMYHRCVPLADVQCLLDVSCLSQMSSLRCSMFLTDAQCLLQMSSLRCLMILTDSMSHRFHVSRECCLSDVQCISDVSCISRCVTCLLQMFFYLADVQCLMSLTNV